MHLRAFTVSPASERDAAEVRARRSAPPAVASRPKRSVGLRTYVPVISQETSRAAESRRGHPRRPAAGGAPSAPASAALATRAAAGLRSPAAGPLPVPRSPVATIRAARAGEVRPGTARLEAAAPTTFARAHQATPHGRPLTSSSDSAPGCLPMAIREAGAPAAVAPAAVAPATVTSDGHQRRSRPRQARDHRGRPKRRHPGAGSTRRWSAHASLV